MIMIRLERMTLKPDEDQHRPAPANAIRIRVRDKIYVGSGLRVIGQASAGELLQIWPSNLTQTAAIQPGQQMLASWSLSDCVVLAR